MVQGGVDEAQVVRDLRDIAQALDDYPTLVRALTDTSVPIVNRSRLVDNALPGMCDGARSIIKSSLDKTWDTSRALTTWVENSAVDHAWGWAQDEQLLDTAITEVFSFGQAVRGNHELRAALTDRRAPEELQLNLARTVASAMCEPAQEIIALAVGSVHGTIDDRIAEFVDMGASKADAILAVVHVARPLDEVQRSRLATVLTTRMGTNVVLEVIVDPTVLGGIRIECGADVIDATVMSRLEAARRALAQEGTRRSNG